MTIPRIASLITVAASTASLALPVSGASANTSSVALSSGSSQPQTAKSWESWKRCYTITYAWAEKTTPVPSVIIANDIAYWMCEDLLP